MGGVFIFTFSISFHVLRLRQGQRGTATRDGVAGHRGPLQRHQGSGRGRGGRSRLGRRQEPGDHQVGRDHGALHGGWASEERRLRRGRGRVHGGLDGSQQGPVHEKKQRQGRVKTRRREEKKKKMLKVDHGDIHGPAPPWANGESRPLSENPTPKAPSVAFPLRWSLTLTRKIQQYSTEEFRSAMLQTTSSY